MNHVKAGIELGELWMAGYEAAGARGERGATPWGIVGPLRDILYAYISSKAHKLWAWHSGQNRVAAA